MPWRFRLVERQRGYIFFRFDQHQDSGTARRTGSKEKELRVPFIEGGKRGWVT